MIYITIALSVILIGLIWGQAVINADPSEIEQAKKEDEL